MTTNPPAISERDVREASILASKQSVLYMFITGLQKMGYNDLLNGEYDKQMLKTTYDYVQRKESLNRISEVLKSECIPYVPLKGAILRDLYPQPCMRTSSDIDILIHEEDLENAIKALESKTSFRLQKRAYHDVHLLNERLHLELHFSLMTNLEKLDLVFSRAWEYAVPLDNDYQYVFSPEYQVFYIAAHAAKHLIHAGGVGIRPLLDLWLLRTGTMFDEQVVETLCQEAGILKFYQECCKLLSVWFENAEHTDITRRLETFLINGSVFGTAHSKVLSRNRKKQGNSYVLSRIFKSGKEIKAYYPVCQRHPSLIPVYQIVRWTHLLDSEKRREVRDEIAHANSLNQSEVEAFDSLLKDVGL